MDAFLDFFSGIGLFRLGLEQAGFECMGHCEIDKYANRSYQAMHHPKESEWFAEDICKVSASSLPRHNGYAVAAKLVCRANCRVESLGRRIPLPGRFYGRQKIRDTRSTNWLVF